MSQMSATPTWDLSNPIHLLDGFTSETQHTSKNSKARSLVLRFQHPARCGSRRFWFRVIMSIGCGNSALHLIDQEKRIEALESENARLRGAASAGR